MVAGESIGDIGGTIGFEVYSDRMEPHSPGLPSRVWYGGGSLQPAQRAGENGVHFSSSIVIRAEESQVFDDVQQTQIRQVPGVRREAHWEGPSLPRGPR